MCSSSPTTDGWPPADRIRLLPRAFRHMTERCSVTGWPPTWRCRSPIRQQCWPDPRPESDVAELVDDVLGRPGFGLAVPRPRPQVGAMRVFQFDGRFADR